MIAAAALAWPRSPLGPWLPARTEAELARRRCHPFAYAPRRRLFSRTMRIESAVEAAAISGSREWKAIRRLRGRSHLGFKPIVARLILVKSHPRAASEHVVTPRKQRRDGVGVTARASCNDCSLVRKSGGAPFHRQDVPGDVAGCGAMDVPAAAPVVSSGP